MGAEDHFHAGHERIEIDSTTTETTKFLTTLTPAISSRFEAGRWEWVARVVGTTGTTTAATGCVDVLPVPEAAHVESFAEEALAMVEASLRGDMPTAEEAVSTTGIDLTKTSIAERIEIRERLKAEVVRQRQLDRLKNGADGLEQGAQIRFR